MLTWPTKDPDELIDYTVNWADQVNGPRLILNELLTSCTFSVVSGSVTINRQSFVATGLGTVWLQGGTEGDMCVVLCRVVTNQGRNYDQSTKIRIRTR